MVFMVKFKMGMIITDTQTIDRMIEEASEQMAVFRRAD